MLSPGDRFLIIASDGVWDVVTADVAIARAAAAVADGLDPALELTDYALGQHNVRGSADNVTVIIVEFLREVSGRA
jgi:serine/threonine protein phosphatase PrpC